jgi:uncharacterized protein YkwD
MYKKILLFLAFFAFSMLANADYTTLYDVVPDIPNCGEGKLKSTETQKVLDYINKVRALHKLPAVTYNTANDVASQKTSLIMASNELLDHNPQTNYSCYSDLGKAAAASSNLYISYVYGSSVESSENSVSSWMNDNGVAECGHRRWIINPWVTNISYGRVDGKSKQNPQFNVTATNLYYVANATKNLNTLENDFIAYPYQEYPKELVYDSDGKIWKFSFTAIQDKTNQWNNQTINYGNATISIVDESNVALAISNKVANNQGYGVPNALIWDVSGLQNNKKYTVTISNVVTSGGIRNYTYWFKLIDGWPVSNALATPTLSAPKDATTNQGNPITLKWNAVPNATNYEVYVSETPYPSSKYIVSKKGITTTSFVVDSNIIAPLTKYYWGVKAYDANGGFSAWSGEFTFATKQANAPKIPSVFFPENGAVNVNVRTKFVWSSVTASLVEKNNDSPQAMISYTLQICKKNDFIDNVLDLDLNDTTYTADVDELPVNTKLYWRVRGMNYQVAGSWSTVMSYNTADPSDVENNTQTQTSEFYNYPNPFEDRTNIIYVSKFDTDAQIEIFDLLGNKIAEVFNGKLISGINKFDVKLNNGIYYCRISGNNINTTIKLVSDK